MGHLLGEVAGNANKGEVGNALGINDISKGWVAVNSI